jgi:hypothetical protein
MNEKRTMRGKVVGSYRPPLESWTYWAERDWTTGEPGFVVVAPSGARMEWVRTEADAKWAAEIHNLKMRGELRPSWMVD